MTKQIIPIFDTQAKDTLLDKVRRDAFDSYAREEVPKLRNISAVLANEYFNYGWDAALSTSKPIVTKQTFEFTPTNIQMATVMALTGTNKQKEEARAFFSQFLNKIKID